MPILASDADPCVRCRPLRQMPTLASEADLCVRCRLLHQMPPLASDGKSEHRYWTARRFVVRSDIFSKQTMRLIRIVQLMASNQREIHEQFVAIVPICSSSVAF